MGNNRSGIEDFFALLDGKNPAILAECMDLPKNLGIVSFSRPLEKDTAATELVNLKNGSAGYGGKHLFTGLNLKIHTSDHTLVTGPNGCGKSTLLQVITGDHPACYQNDLRIFGTQRGTGESIWELKRDMGIVSHRQDEFRDFFKSRIKLSPHPV